jgi:hydroxyethylthiazole kinase
MIISPHLLPSQALSVGRETDFADANTTAGPDRDVCAVGMQECAPGNGAYPVTHNFGGYGGAHLMAPRAANDHAKPVRAIADGTIVFVRQNSPQAKPELQYCNVRADRSFLVPKRISFYDEEKFVSGQKRTEYAKRVPCDIG